MPLIGVIAAATLLAGCGDGCSGDPDAGTFVRQGIDASSSENFPLRWQGTSPDADTVSLDLKDGTTSQQDALRDLAVGDTADLGDGVTVTVVAICSDGAAVRTEGSVLED